MPKKHEQPPNAIRYNGSTGTLADNDGGLWASDESFIPPGEARVKVWRFIGNGPGNVPPSLADALRMSGGFDLIYIQPEPDPQD